MTLPSDPDCYWVVPGRFVAGEYPGDWIRGLARRKLGGLLDVGVRTFLDLTEEGELTAYDDWLRKEARARQIEVEYHRHPVRDLDVPTPEGMRAILDVIDRSIAAERPVYVHCWGGIGRTGTVVCCWLIERGRSCEDALADIRQLREGIQKRMIQSPEMDGQREFVRAWVRAVR
jgi:protein-tyrosine phosphatase